MKNDHKINKNINSDPCLQYEPTALSKNDCINIISHFEYGDSSNTVQNGFIVSVKLDKDKSKDVSKICDINNNQAEEQELRLLIPEY